MARKKKEPEMKSWIVRVREEVERDYVVSAATEDEARDNYSSGEECPVGDYINWKVISVRENT